MSETRQYKVIVETPHGNQWEDAIDASPLRVEEAPDIEFFVHRVGTTWRVSEYTTGRSCLSIYQTYETPEDAIEEMKFRMRKIGAKAFRNKIAQVRPKREAGNGRSGDMSDADDHAHPVAQQTNETPALKAGDKVVAKVRVRWISSDGETVLVDTNPNAAAISVTSEDVHPASVLDDLRAKLAAAEAENDRRIEDVKGAMSERDAARRELAEALAWMRGELGSGAVKATALEAVEHGKRGCAILARHALPTMEDLTASGLRAWVQGQVQGIADGLNLRLAAMQREIDAMNSTDYKAISEKLADDLEDALDSAKAAIAAAEAREGGDANQGATRG